MSKRVLFFGIYDPNYSRNRVLSTGFRENGWEVRECRVDPKMVKGGAKYTELWREGKLAAKEKYDLVIVAFPGHTVVWLARLLFGPHIIFDMFVSLYNSEVEDRGTASRVSPSGVYNYLLDWYSVRLASYVLLETKAHIAYISKLVHVPEKKFIRVFVGSSIAVEGTSHVSQGTSSPFVIHFHGSGIPLQGIEYIRSARELLKEEKDLEWRIYDGRPWIAFDDLVEKMKEADIVLGIFGTTRKASMVIPNKVYEGLAVGKAIITADTPAIHELLTNGENVRLCRAGDPQDLAAKILELKNNAILRKGLAAEGHKLAETLLLPKTLVEKLLHELRV